MSPSKKNRPGFVSGSLIAFVEARRDFWNELCPDTRKLVELINRSLRTSPLRAPLRPENRSVAGPLGTATDYYMGWLTGETLEKQVVCMSGVSRDARVIADHLAIRFRVLRAKERLSRSEKEHLGRACLALAQLESAYRAGNRRFIPSMTGLEASAGANEAERFDLWLRRQIQTPLLEEWLMLADRAEKLPLLLRHVVYNPVFGRYGAINGSDGDLLVDGTLYELKCSVDGFEGDAIRQLLGYCSLNILNDRSFAIHSVGLVNLRRGFVWAKEVEAVCSSVGARSLSHLVSAMKSTLKMSR